MKIWVALAAAALATSLAGCGASSSGAAAASTPTTSTTAGPSEFVAWAHHASYGTKDFASSPDDAVLAFGNVICSGFSDSSLSYGSEVQALTEGSGSPSASEAQAFIDHAVPNLCPEYASRLP